MFAYLTTIPISQPVLLALSTTLTVFLFNLDRQANASLDAAYDWDVAIVSGQEND